MVRFDVDEFDGSIVDDLSFMKLLHAEENVAVLPGCAFGMVGGGFGCASSSSSTYAFRVVFCAPERILRIAAERISSFCLRHKRV